MCDTFSTFNDNSRLALLTRYIAATCRNHRICPLTWEIKASFSQSVIFICSSAAPKYGHWNRFAHQSQLHLDHWQYWLRLRLGNLVLGMLRPIILKVQQYEKSVGELSITFANRVLFHTLSSWGWAKKFLVFQNERTQESLWGRYVFLLRYVQGERTLLLRWLTWNTTHISIPAVLPTFHRCTELLGSETHHSTVTSC